MMTGGRLAASVLMMLSMIGAMVTFLAEAGIDQVEWQRPVVAAAVVGLMAGWSQLGANLGRDFLQAGLFGIGAALVGLLFFALLFGVRSAWITHSSVQFDAAIEVIGHIIDAGIRVIQRGVESQKTVAAFLIGALCTGIIAEFCHRIWR